VRFVILFDYLKSLYSQHKDRFCTDVVVFFEGFCCWATSSASLSWEENNKELYNRAPYANVYIRMCAYVQDAVYPWYRNIFSVGGSLCRKKRTNLKEKRSAFFLFLFLYHKKREKEMHPEWVDIFSLYDISTANQIFSSLLLVFFFLLTISHNRT
jgi:hypothetical protein